MTTGERTALGVGMWLLLGAVVNGAAGKWLPTAVCLLFAGAAFTWVFGNANDRARRRREREHRDLIDRLEAEVRAEQEAETSGEWVRNEEGFYVRRQPGDDPAGAAGDGSR